jgi:hypothetical protein
VFVAQEVDWDRIRERLNDKKDCGTCHGLAYVELWRGNPPEKVTIPCPACCEKY